MVSLVLGLRVVLAAVFSIAGVAKLLDRDGSQRALRDFGLGHRAVKVIGPLLPLAELAVAAGLIFPVTATAAAAGALALLLFFAGGISRAMLRGQAPDCHCFGQLHSAPAGWPTLLRNVGLAALAAVVLVEGPGPAIDRWVGDRTAAELASVALGIATVVLATYAWRLRGENRMIREAALDARTALGASPQGLPEGSHAPDFELVGAVGATASLTSLLQRGKPVLLVFTDPHCGPCQALWPDLGRWQTALAPRITIAVLAAGSPEDNLPIVEEHGLLDVLLDPDAKVAASYGVRGTPSALVVGKDATVASPLANTAFTIEALTRVQLRRPSRPSGGTVLDLQLSS